VPGAAVAQYPLEYDTYSDDCGLYDLWSVDKLDYEGQGPGNVSQFLWKQSFKYEDVRTALMLFGKGDKAFTFDLKSGYHHVDIHESCWKYLGL